MYISERTHKCRNSRVCMRTHGIIITVYACARRVLYICEWAWGTLSAAMEWIAQRACGIPSLPQPYSRIRCNIILFEIRNGAWDDRSGFSTVLTVFWIFWNGYAPFLLNILLFLTHGLVMPVMCFAPDLVCFFFNLLRVWKCQWDYLSMNSSIFEKHLLTASYR